jgi:probable rRNA maturation factor
MPVRFHFQTPINITGRRTLKKFITTIFAHENKKLNELDIVFCDNAYLLAINQKFLEHDFYTDIITFDLSPDSNSFIVGEIYISVEMVRHNAVKFNAEFLKELRRVIFHGALHLCGYKDKTKPDTALMRIKEAEYLKMFHGEH